MQKFSSTGQAMWGAEGVLIYNLGQMSAWTYPQIYPAEAGGAFAIWHDSPTSTQFTVRVAYVAANGHLIFPLNGALASTNTSRLHMNPTLSFIPETDELFAFWVEENSGQTQYGLYGQKFTLTGTRLWGDEGHQYIGLSANPISFVQSGVADTSVYIGYFESSTTELNSAVKAFRIEPDSSIIWGMQLLSSETLGGKDDLLLAVNSENRAFFVWDDARSDIGDIYAQNVNFDGTLGNPITGVTITLTPFNPPIQIPATGGVFNFNISATNSGTAGITADIWTMVTLPNGNLYGPIINVTNFPISTGQTVNRDRTQAVPANAPAGNYTYDAYIGDYPNGIIDEDHFDFVKIAISDDSKIIKDWFNWGEDFGGEANSTLINPHDYGLLRAYPNPFNSATTINFDLQSTTEVDLVIYDINGREVRRLASGICISELMK
jgi:hypothetical protein